MSIFREYDIRGIFGEDLRQNVVVAIGAELGREIMARGGRSVAIGYDAGRIARFCFDGCAEGLNSDLGNHCVDLQNSHKNDSMNTPEQIAHKTTHLCKFTI